MCVIYRRISVRYVLFILGNNKDDLSFEMIEIGCKPDSTNISVCPATGNLLVVSGSNLTIYKYTLASQHASKIKYIDFQVIAVSTFRDQNLI